MYTEKLLVTGATESNTVCFCDETLKMPLVVETSQY